MATGTIARLAPDRGFGFIRPEGAGPRGADLFFHASVLEGASFDALRPGQRVEYEPGVDPRDPSRRRAVRVRPRPAE